MNRRMRRADRRGQKATPKPIHRDQDFIGSFIEHGRLLLNDGRDQEAMEIAKRAILLEENDASRAFFLECVRRWSYFPGAEEIRGVLARALTERWATLSDLGSIPLELLKRDPVITRAIARVSAEWPQRLSLSTIFGTEGVASVFNDSLLIALLESGKNIDLDFEPLFTSIRAALLELHFNDRVNVGEDVLNFCCALAQQCFLNEYVFDVTTTEGQTISALRQQIIGLIANRGQVRPIWVALLACYESLDRLPDNEGFLKRRWPHQIDELLDQQIREPLARRGIGDSIPQITPIDDVTSINVKAQYEDSPYPRWVWFRKKTQTSTFDASVRRSFPFSDYRSIEKKEVDVLVAGCGTGQHSIVVAQTYPAAKILAIDLSRQSLAYAKQKTQAMKIGNIEYAQADILELGGTDRRFDFISSAGVLHHLRDPEDGWRKLLALLRPEGCMHLGFYSETARAGVILAQKWLRACGYTASTDDIRRARQALVDSASSEPLFKDVFKFWDFYSTSECRDLLFHVQESNFTIPRIQSFLSQNNLRFLGFIVDADYRNLFAREFGREREADLELWQQFEAMNPNTFRGMYEFWVQRMKLN